jgi:putative nucleotidyltransferase with HDIG domain
MDKETFLRKLDAIPDLPTLPVVALKVNKMLQDENVSIKSLSTTIEKDQAMVSKILRLVNSAFYGFRSQINTISHAITILGFSTVRNAIVSIAVMDVFPGKDPFDGFDMTRFWKHAVAVAVTGRNLAEKSRLVPPDEAFVAGILHDVGKVVLAQYFTEIFAGLWKSIQEEGCSFCEAEKKFSPVGHAHIGGKLAKRWQLPVSLLEAIAYHHVIKKSAVGVNLIHLIHVSDHIVNNAHGGEIDKMSFSKLDPDAAMVLAIQLKHVSEWFPTVSQEIEEAWRFFIENPADTSGDEVLETGSRVQHKAVP